MNIKKIKKTNSNKKIIISVVLVLSLLIISSIVFLILQRYNTSSAQSENSKPAITTPATTKEIENGNAIKKASLESQPQNENTSSIPASITAANQNGSMLQIRVLIQKISSTGTCTLTLTQSSLSKTYTTDIQASAANSTCKGFDVPISDLGATGNWDINITISIDSQQQQLSKSVIIN